MIKPKIFPILAALLLLAVIVIHVQAKGNPAGGGSPQAGSSVPPQTINVNSDCFALSNEATGDLISNLVSAGYGDFNLYQSLVAIQSNTDPSVAGIITNAYLALLAGAPASSEIFTIKLNTMDTPGITVEVCTNGTAQTEPISGYFSAAKGFPTLVSNISGVGYANFTYSTGTSGPIATWDVTTGVINTTYHVFGVAWGVGEPPYSIYLPLVVR